MDIDRSGVHLCTGFQNSFTNGSGSICNIDKGSSSDGTLDLGGRLYFRWAVLFQIHNTNESDNYNTLSSFIQKIFKTSKHSLLKKTN